MASGIRREPENQDNSIDLRHQDRQRMMEPLWSPVVATSRKRSQIARRRQARNQAETVAVGCEPLPATFHGKEGVDGSSPSEGLEVPANQRVMLSP